MDKYKMIKFLLIPLILIFVSGCSEKPVQPTNSTEAAWKAKLAISMDNYNKLNELYSEGRRDSLSKDEFEELKERITSGASYTHYELVEFENGKMILIRLTPEKDDKGLYYIEDIKIVPDNLKEIFVQVVEK